MKIRVLLVAGVLRARRTGFKVAGRWIINSRLVKLNEGEVGSRDSSYEAVSAVRRL